MSSNLYEYSRTNSSDRFIPRRANVNFDLSYYHIKKSDESHTYNPFTSADSDCFVNTAKYFYNIKQYRSELWKVMMPDERNRILRFSSPKKIKSKPYVYPETNVWPVRARSHPLIGPPSIILDMPDLDTNICHHVVDWGKKGYIGTIYEKEVHLWHPEQKLQRHVTRTSGRVQHCVKWNRDGTHFAMSLNFSSIAIWDCETCKTCRIISCCCIFSGCTVTSMEWTKENYLITGCSEGRLCSWTPDFICIKTYFMAHMGDIINIKTSCRGTYLVTTGIDRTVRFWKWPDFSEHCEISTLQSPVKSVAWHPWRDSLLAMGGPKYTSVWNVNTKQALESKRHPHKNSRVDSMTFNPLSGELVMSYYSYCNPGGNGVHFLTVLRDLSTIVDEVQFHSGRVPYLLWDADGTKLATASADENLCIWDFFGASSETEKKFLRLSKGKELTTDMFKNLNVFNSFIR